MQRISHTLTLAALLALPPVLQAQQGLWRYNLPAPILGTRGFQVAGNGDLLLPYARLAPDGSVIWQRNYQVVGSLLPAQMGHFAAQGSDLVGLGLYDVDFAYRLALLYTNADGQPTGGLRIDDPSAPVGLLGPWDQVVPAPDGGVLVLKGGAYYINADGSLRWALRHTEFQRPHSVAWAADGGFYGVGNGAGILRYGPDGQVVRVMNTLGDTYNGIQSITVKHAPVLHDHQLYVGISSTFMEAGVLRTNAGVMLMDTLGNLLGHVMNSELLSPPSENAAGAHLALAVVGDRLLATITIKAATSGTLAYLLDSDLQLGDTRWYALPQGGETYLSTAHPYDGTVVLGGSYMGGTLGGRVVPGTELGTCLDELAFEPAPIVVVAFAGTPDAATPVAVTLEPLTIASMEQPLLTVTQPCNFTGMEEVEPLQLRLYPNPAADVVTLEWQEPLPPHALLRLYDTTGRCVRQERPLGNTHRMDVSALAPGMYRLEMADLPGTRAGATVHVLR